MGLPITNHNPVPIPNRNPCIGRLTCSDVVVVLVLCRRRWRSSTLWNVSTQISWKSHSAVSARCCACVSDVRTTFYHYRSKATHQGRYIYNGTGNSAHYRL